MSKPRRRDANTKRATSFDKLKESDRGCVILMGAILDDDLRRLHQAQLQLLAAKGIAKKIDVDRKLSNFGIRIFAAFECDLITKEQHEALNFIRILRNEAAHSEYKFSFDDFNVIETLNKLRMLINPERANTARAGRKRDFIALVEKLHDTLKTRHLDLVKAIDLKGS